MKNIFHVMNGSDDVQDAATECQGEQTEELEDELERAREQLAVRTHSMVIARRMAGTGAGSGAGYRTAECPRPLDVP